jgi:ABC-type uncharacterized transport system auxiliary subunit
MRQAIAGLAVALAVVTLAGCGAARPSKYYKLEVAAAPPVASSNDAYPVGLLVGRLTAPHLFREDRIVYRTGPGQMGTYDNHRWAEPPTEMIEVALLHMLRASGRYRTVQLLQSNARGDYIVRGRLQDLEELAGKSLGARVTLVVELYEIKSGTTVWSEPYSHDEPVNGKTVADVVDALTRNVQHGLEQAVGGINQYFATHPQK